MYLHVMAKGFGSRSAMVYGACCRRVVSCVLSVVELEGLRFSTLGSGV